MCPSTSVLAAFPSIRCVALILFSAVMAFLWSEEIDTGWYLITVTEGTKYTRMGTVDSEAGHYDFSELKLKIHADVGLMAGTKVSGGKGEEIASGILRLKATRDAFPKDIKATIDGTVGEKRRYANFWARINTEEQYKAFDSLIRSFKWK